MAKKNKRVINYEKPINIENSTNVPLSSYSRSFGIHFPEENEIVDFHFP